MNGKLQLMISISICSLFN